MRYPDPLQLPVEPAPLRGHREVRIAATLVAQRRLSRQAGQGMTEYLIVVALIAVAAIGVYSLFGQTLRSQTAGLAMEISGQSSGTAVSAAQGSANSAQSSASQRKGLGNYGLDNQ